MRTHRCKELLDYNENNFQPCQIVFEKTFSFFDKEEWVLKYLHTDYEYDCKSMKYVSTIRYCPFCGREFDS